MSSEPDYNFNSPAPVSNSEGMSLQIPFALLTAAIAIVMVAQTWGTFRQRTALRENKTKLIEVVKNRETLVQQSREIQKKLEKIIRDLLVLAMTDKDAQAIVQKYHIQQGNPTGAAEAPASPEAPK
jgi:hypothetical protein